MPSSASDPAAASGHRIAVIDDDQAVLSALGFALRLDGYEVATYAEPDSLFADPDIAVADCLIIDQRLPGRPGLTVLEDLRRQGVAAPAILITTQPDAACRRDAARAGVVIVEKPLMGDGLRLVIERLIRDGSGG